MADPELRLFTSESVTQGHHDLNLSWERTDLADELRAARPAGNAA